MKSQNQKDFCSLMYGSFTEIEESLAEEAGKDINVGAILGIVGAIGTAILTFLGYIYRKRCLPAETPGNAQMPAASAHLTYQLYPTEPAENFNQAFRMRPDTFYHATTEANALRIQEGGFVIPAGPGGLLGRGVYCTSTFQKAMEYLKGPHGGIIFVLQINLGNCKQLVKNDPMMTSWQQNGYDSAWAPFSAVNPDDNEKEENCIKDPKRIAIVQALAGNTGKLRLGGFDIVNMKLKQMR